jgi:hypothetical protein
MGLNGVTNRYLERIPERLALQPDQEPLRGRFEGVFLSRPLFLDTSELTGLHHDLVSAQRALHRLPDALFGGDRAAFMRAVGLTDEQIAVVDRTPDPSPSVLSRADLYRTGDGFRMLELNTGSVLGGFEVGDVCRAMLADRRFAEFAEDEGLTFVDPMPEMLTAIRAACRLDSSSTPVMALAGWPEAPGAIRGDIVRCSRTWTALGLRTLPCNLPDLTVRPDGVWLGDQRIDIVYRAFLIDNILETPDAARLMIPVVDASVSGTVALFTPMDSELYGSKLALAMLSDRANHPLFAEADRSAIDRIVPWTRVLRHGDTTLPDGTTGDLVEYVLANRTDLIVKPAIRYGGLDVTPGWLTDDERWSAVVGASDKGGHVVQSRVRSVLEPAVTDSGELADWVVNWGVFLAGDRFAGLYSRAESGGQDVGVVNLLHGAGVGVFHLPVALEPTP